MLKHMTALLIGVATLFTATPAQADVGDLYCVPGEFWPITIGIEGDEEYVEQELGGHLVPADTTECGPLPEHAHWPTGMPEMSQDPKDYVQGSGEEVEEPEEEAEISRQGKPLKTVRLRKNDQPVRERRVMHAERRSHGRMYVQLNNGAAWRMTACQYEDSNNCVWDARRRGNRTGSSYIKLQGKTFYLPLRNRTYDNHYPCTIFVGDTSIIRCRDGFRTTS